MSSDFIGYLSVDLIQFLLDYFEYEGKIQFITTNTVLSRKFLKSTRRITKSISCMLRNPLTRERTLSLIENPYHQLELKMDNFIQSLSNEALQAVKVFGESVDLFLDYQTEYDRIFELSMRVTDYRNLRYRTFIDYLSEKNAEKGKQSLGLRHLKIEEFSLYDIEDRIFEVDENEENQGMDFSLGLHHFNLEEYINAYFMNLEEGIFEVEENEENQGIDFSLGLHHINLEEFDVDGIDDDEDEGIFEVEENEENQGIDFSLGLHHFNLEEYINAYFMNLEEGIFEVEENEENQGIDFSLGLHHFNLEEYINANFMNLEEEEWGDWFVFPFIPNLFSFEFKSRIYEKLSSEYSYLQKLTLKRCLRLNDVSSFGNIYDLTLERCPRVRDISALQNNYRIKVLYCDKIENYTQSFRNSVHIQIKSYNSGHVLSTNVSYWSMVRYLTVDGFLFDSGLLLLPSLLSSCTLGGYKSYFPQLVDYELLRFLCITKVTSSCLDSMKSLGSIPVLELRHIRNLISLEGLGKGNRKVVIEDCNEVTDFSPLRFIETVEILGCAKFTNIAHVDHVQNLKIRGVFPIKDFSLLVGHTQHLFLVYANAFVPFFGANHVPTIEIELLQFILKDLVKNLEDLFAENHEKIIFHLNEDAYYYSLPLNDSYYQTIFHGPVKRSKVVVYLRKSV